MRILASYLAYSNTVLPLTDSSLNCHKDQLSSFNSMPSLLT